MSIGMARSLLLSSLVTETAAATLHSITTRKSRGSLFRSITRSLATSKISGNTSLALASEQGRQRSQSRRGICPIARRSIRQVRGDSIVKQSGGDIFIVASAAYAKQGASESRMLDYFESCRSCRRLTNCVEKTAANRPTIGKSAVASGIGATLVAALHSSNPPFP